MGIRGSPTAELSFRRRARPGRQPGRRGGRGLRDRDADLRSQPARDRRPGRRHRAGSARGGRRATPASGSSSASRSASFQMIAGDARRHGRPAPRPPASSCTRRASEIEAGAPDAARWSAMCKLVAGDTAMRVTTDAVQVLGGYGYIDEFPVERMMRDAKITQLYEGTQQIQRLVIARALRPRLTGLRAEARRPETPTVVPTRRQRRPARVQIVVLTSSPCPTPPRAASASGPDWRLDRAACPAVVNAQRRVRARGGAQARRGARRRGGDPLDGAGGGARNDAQGARDGRPTRGPRHGPGARGLRHGRHDAGPRGRAQGLDVRPGPGRRRHVGWGGGRRARRASRRCSGCRTSRTPRRSSPTPIAGRVRVRRISADGLRRPRGADARAGRLHPGARRAALPVAEGDHGGPLEGDRHDGPGRRRGGRDGRRRRRRDDEGPRRREAAGRARATRVVRGAPDEAASEVVAFLAERRII